MPCVRQLEVRRARCRKRKFEEKRCYLPQCSRFNSNRFSLIQCWKYMGNCWCADSRTGKRNKNKPVARYKNMHKMTYCLPGKALALACTWNQHASIGFRQRHKTSVLHAVTLHSKLRSYATKMHDLPYMYFNTSNQPKALNSAFVCFAKRQCDKYNVR